MARLKRVAPVGVAQHVIQRGNNRQVCFTDKQDMAAYLSWLQRFSDQFEVEIHAWVLMTNHVHLLCTPRKEMAVSKMMQSLGRMYVRYFNHKFGRTGTLWEGRFKACLVERENYLLEVYRYIELNPIRAGMVNDPSEYSWSSYCCNALGKETKLRSPHDVYMRLGTTTEDRLTAYRNLFEVHVSQELVNELRKCTNSGVAFAGQRFVKEIENLQVGRVSARVAGRPRSR